MTPQSLHDFLSLLGGRFHATRCPQVAGSLAFTTLLSLVPLMTVVLGVFTTVPAAHPLGLSLKTFLLENVLPEGSGRIIAEHALQFSQQAGRLTLIGTVMLAMTALVLLGTIEQVLNLIWGVRRPRPMLIRITVSWFVLTLGPVAFGASVIATGYLVTHSMAWAGDLPWLGQVAARLLPPLLLGALFSFLYYAVPNHPVRALHALAGGLSAAIVFFLMQRLFGLFLARFPSYALIYGAFAVLPIFLMWLYLSWLVILLGALIAASLPAFLERGHLSPAFPGSRAWAALDMLDVLGRAQWQGETVGFETLRRHAGLAEHAAESLLDGLREAGWVTRSEDGDWVLSRSPEQIRVRQVIERFALSPADWLSRSGSGSTVIMAGRLHAALETADATLASLLLTDPAAPTT